MQLLHLLVQEGNGHGAASAPRGQRVDLSVWGRTYRRVVVVPPPVPFLGRPHSGVRLRGAVRQRRIAGVIFLVVFRLVTLGEDKGLLLGTPAVALGL